MKMRNFFVSIFLFLAAIIFTSCVEVVQVIGFEKNVYKIDLRMMISKSVMELADMNEDDIFSSMGLEGLPGDIKVKKIDTELECGVVLSSEINPSSKNDDAEFLPKIVGNKVEIPLPLPDDFDSGLSAMRNSDEMTQAIFEMLYTSAKWRIMISKKIVPTASKVYLESRYGTKKVEFFSAGEILCINIPMTYLVGSDLKVVIEK